MSRRIAPLGTALTEAQAGLLKKYSKNIYLLYDSDAAGLKATFRAGDELLSQGSEERLARPSRRKAIAAG